MHAIAAHGWQGRYHAVALSHNDEEINQHFRNMRAASNVHDVLLDQAPRVSLQQLRKGDSVIILSDRDYSQHGQYFQMGRAQIRLPLGPARLARQCKTIIRPIFFLRRSWSTYMLILGPTISPDYTLSKEADTQRMLGQLDGHGTRTQCSTSNWFISLRKWK